VAMARLARHYENGARKYGDRNWEKGQPLGSYLDSALRHINVFLAGGRDEDHLSAAAWNLFSVIHTQEMIERGLLPKGLDDLPDFKKRARELALAGRDIGILQPVEIEDSSPVIDINGWTPKVGDFGVTRNGEKVRIDDITNDEDDPYPIEGEILHEGDDDGQDFESWQFNGLAFNDGESENDLVGPWCEPYTINGWVPKVGDIGVMRNGREARITEVDSQKTFMGYEYPIVGDEGGVRISWTRRGVWRVDQPEPSPFDLVGLRAQKWMPAKGESFLMKCGSRGICTGVDDVERIGRIWSAQVAIASQVAGGRAYNVTYDATGHLFGLDRTIDDLDIAGPIE
jgi:hypothetical protein